MPKYSIRVTGISEYNTHDKKGNINGTEKKETTWTAYVEQDPMKDEVKKIAQRLIQILALDTSQDVTLEAVSSTSSTVWNILRREETVSVYILKAGEISLTGQENRIQEIDVLKA